MKFFQALLLAMLTVIAVRSARGDVEVRSPDERIIFLLKTDATGALSYELSRDRRPVIRPSALGINIGGQKLGREATIGEPKRSAIDETYPTRGTHSLASNHCRQAVIPITSGKAKASWTLEVRVFNDGAAYRYHLGEEGPRRVDGEESTWQLPEGAVAFFQEAKADYESAWREAPLGKMTLDPGVTLGAPIMFQLPDGGYAAITEANLIAYSDMTLEPVGPAGFHAVFPNDIQGWRHDGELISPWRVSIVVGDLTALVNSDIITNLCPAPTPDLANADWIQPGRSTWQWMVTRHPKLPEQHQWIDWTRQLGFEYYLIDDGWNRWKSEGKDYWECMRAVVDYATSQKVKVWVWLHSKDIPDALARRTWFAKAHEMGIAGLKVDFPKPASVEWVQWYEDLRRDAASARLMLDFHGAIKPTGRERTWPNELTREAVRGNENRKADVRTEVILPFTRLVQGPADFTPTDFRADYLSGRSWPHMLAQSIVFVSPLLCFDGSPDDYLKSEALEFIKAIPATWEESIVLPATKLGQIAAIARRKGDEWFIGVLNGTIPHSVEIKLSFLPPGSYQLDQFSDIPEREGGWEQRQGAVTAKDTLRVQLRSSGGFVARLSKKKL